MPTSHSDQRGQEIIEFVSSRMAGIPDDFRGDEIAGFIFEDLILELCASPREILDAVDKMLLWAEVETSIWTIGRSLRATTRATSPTGGYVYLFKNGHQYKIGISTNPEARLSALNRAAPPSSAKTILEVKFWVDSPKDVESIIHRVLAHKRVESDTGGQEWFFPNGEELRWVHETLAGFSNQSTTRNE